MEEVPGIDFRMTPEQRRFYEGGRREIWLGQRGGRTHMIEMLVIGHAANEEEARLCLDDLHTTGFCLQSSDGRRIDPKPKPRGEDPRIRFDEEEKKT